MRKFFPQYIFITILFFCFCNTARAQHSYYFYNDHYMEPDIVFEAGITAGAMNCMTDIGGNRKSESKMLSSFTLYNTKWVGGIFVSGTLKDILAARLQYTLGQIEGADSLTAGLASRSAQGRANRNLSFRTSINELSLNFEFHPDFLWRGVDAPPAFFSPYLLAGIGYFHFNPQALYGYTWIDLAPLRLEGQGFEEYPDRKPYKQNAFSIPLGLGVRYELCPQIYLRAEAAVHITNTDYLDDVSQEKYIDPALFYSYLSPSDAYLATQLFNRNKKNTATHIELKGTRGTPSSKDLFWTASLNIGFVLNRKRI